MCPIHPRNPVEVGTPATYRIVVRGAIAQLLSGWLSGVQITTGHHEPDGPTTTIVGRMRDQAELNGLLNSLYDMHLPVLSVEIIDDQETNT